MITLFIFFYFSLSATVISDKVHGGRTAKDGEFPFALSIFAKNGPVCGASLVKVNLMITAAHCFASTGKKTGRIILTDLTKFEVAGGSIDILARKDGFQTTDVVNVTIHSGYKQRIDLSALHDICTGDLYPPFNLSDTLKPIKIPSTNFDEFQKSWDKVVSNKITCYGMGWGTTTNPKDFSPSPTLQVVELIMADSKTCKPFQYGDVDMEKQGEVCGFAKLQGTGLCASDSGGPLYCDDGFNYGVFTSNQDCEDNTKPQYFKLFSYYFDYFKLNEIEGIDVSNSIQNTPTLLLILLLNFV